MEEEKVNDTKTDIKDEANITLFFDNISGKYLGQIDNFNPTGLKDSDLIGGFALRAISPGDFNAIKIYGEFEGNEETTSTVRNNSSLIRIDEKSFSYFKTINEGGDTAGSNEKSLFMIFDVSNKENPILRAEINTKSVTNNESIEDKLDRYPTYLIFDHNNNYIVFGQAHTHPLLAGSKGDDLLSLTSALTVNFSETEVNVPGVSTDGKNNDRKEAMRLGIPYYAIQSYDRSGNIYKVDQMGNLNISTGSGNKQNQIPVGNLKNLGKSLSQFNILLDAFLTNSGYK
ncbi:MAG TPA: hypothetical protein DF296_10850 [Candidatus Margulisbacteria bacterium]|nr:hypothetical protein [Candidatus Margulisiibacteriota bacterium]